MFDSGSLSMMTLLPLCVSGLFALIGIGAIAWTFVNRRKSEASQAWASTTGRVTGSRVQTHSRVGEDGTTYTYEPQVEYEYTVDGQTFQGKRIAFGSFSSSSRSNAEKTVARYSPGSAVTVHYDPAAPREATLERRVAGGVVGFVVGGGLLVVSVCACLLGLGISTSGFAP